MCKFQLAVNSAAALKGWECRIKGVPPAYIFDRLTNCSSTTVQGNTHEQMLLLELSLSSMECRTNKEGYSPAGSQVVPGINY